MSDGYILRGTTPHLTIRLNPDDLTVDRIEALELVFKQDELKMKKTLEDCALDIEDNAILYHFTEQETLAFKPRKTVQFQLRFKVGNEIVGTRMSDISFTDLLSNEAFDAST